MTTKTLLFIFMLGGLAMSSVLQPIMQNKNRASAPVEIGISLAAAALIGWNLWMYKQAASGDKSTSAVERFTRPVAASAAFLTGLVLLLF